MISFKLGVFLFIFTLTNAIRNYYLYGQTMTWHDAKNLCASHNQELAVIQSQEEQDRAKSAAGNEKAWIAYHDQLQEGEAHYIWDAGQPVCYIFWDHGEPNNLGNEDCAVLNWNTSTGAWNDLKCHEHRPVLCSSGTLYENHCPGQNGGDVHYHTLNNYVYTYQGAGDYPYIDNKYLSMVTRNIQLPNTFASVFAAIAMKDKLTSTVLEMWWSGRSAQNVIFNMRNENNDNTNKYPKLLSSESDTVTVYDASPFIITKFPKQHRVEIQHTDYDGFYFTGYYWGRSTFTLQVPEIWKTDSTGLGSNTLCHKLDNTLCLNPTNSTSKEIHNIALSWRITDQTNTKTRLFEQPFHVPKKQLMYHPTQIDTYKLQRAKTICGNHQPCRYDYLSTNDEIFAGLTKKDFSTKFVYVGDKI